MKTTPIIIQEENNIVRTNEPITLGVPFPQGMVKNEVGLKLLNETGDRIALQTQPLALWPDRSVKWFLLDFQASITSRSLLNYQLIPESQNSERLEGISLKKDNDAWFINTGATSFFIDTKVFLPFKRVVKNNTEVIDGSSASCLLTDSNGGVYVPEINDITVETGGRLRTVIKIKGRYRFRNNKDSVLFIARIHFYYNKSFAKIEFVLRNINPAHHHGGLWDLGDKGSVFFKDLTVRIPLSRQEDLQIRYGLEDYNNNLAEIDGDDVIIYQDSSGGENWKSKNHRNRFGKVMHRFRGFEVSSGGKTVDKGLRAQPIIFVGNDQVGISGAIKQFWQNFPKAVTINKNSMELSLYPKQFSDLYELQGGEQKTHVFYLDFGGDEVALDWVHSPLIARSTPEWYSDSKAIPYITFGIGDEEYDQLIEAAVKGGKSFFNKREIVDEYGWRNFGEIYADHEAVRHKGPDPLVSHYNNQYDPIYGCIRQYVIRSDKRWYELMDDLAHHVVDIDIYHTDEDRDEYNGGMFWHTDHYLDAGTATHRSFTKDHIQSRGQGYGGGPGLEHCYTMGMLFHYYLTGEVASKETVLEIAGWVMRVLSCSSTILGAMHKFKKQISLVKRLVKGEHIPFLKYPFTRSTGNSINTLLDAYLLTGDRVYIETVEELIAGCISPKNVIEKRNLLNVEVAWSYNVCLQSVGRYLDVKQSMDETDEMYCYARESLLHYARWMRDNEYPYLDKPEILEFPNETWPAQDIRKSNVFYYAYKYSGAEERGAFLEKAKFFYEYTIKTLLQFDTRTHTRPVVLLLQNHGMHHYFMQYRDSLPVYKQPCKGIPVADEYWSLKTVFTQLAEDLIKAIKNTTLSKELKWLKLRLQNM